MAPHSEETPFRSLDQSHRKDAINDLTTASQPTQSKEPLKLNGVLDQFKSFDVTPVIGKEFPEASLADWLRAPNSDDLIRDLAITSSRSTPRVPVAFHDKIFADLYILVSQRGVVFFRAQDGLNDNLQKELAQRLEELTGKPESSKLHIHPVSNSGREDGGSDDEISVISSVQARKIFPGYFGPTDKKQSGKEGWHSDITFEPVTSDYAILRLVELPSTGGGKAILP